MEATYKLTTLQNATISSKSRQLALIYTRKLPILFSLGLITFNFTRFDLNVLSHSVPVSKGAAIWPHQSQTTSSSSDEVSEWVCQSANFPRIIIDPAFGGYMLFQTQKHPLNLCFFLVGRGEAGLGGWDLKSQSRDW